MVGVGVECPGPEKVSGLREDFRAQSEDVPRAAPDASGAFRLVVAGGKNAEAGGGHEQGTVFMQNTGRLFDGPAGGFVRHEHERDAVVSGGGLLDELGEAFMGINGGSAGPLWGTVFTGMAEGIDDQAELTDLELRKMFTQAKEDFMDISKAKPGDKTMVDALYPAIDAIIETQGSLKEIMAAAAAAADAGAEQTSTMVARFGRAKNMGERSIGTKDPGAVSIAILFNGMAQAL